MDCRLFGRISGPTVSAIIMFIECNMIILNEYVLAPAWILQARAYLRCACCLATISGLVSESWCSCAGPWRQHFGLCQYCDHFSPCTLQVWLLIFVQQHELQQFYPECSSCLHLIIPGESYICQLLLGIVGVVETFQSMPTCTTSRCLVTAYYFTMYCEMWQ